MMTPDNPKPINPNDTDKPFVPAAPELEVPKTYEYKILSEAEEIRLVEQLADRRKEPSEKRFAAYLVKGDEEAAKLAREVEVEVFGEFFDNDEGLMRQEYRKYEESSVFIVIVDHKSKKPAGVMRLISNSESGLKSLNDLAGSPWNKPIDEIFIENEISENDLDTTLDIATLAVRKDYRSKTEVSVALYHALRIHTINTETTEFVTILDDKVLELLASIGCHFNKYKGVQSASYLDSPSSTPVYTSYQQMMDRWEADNMDTYKYIALGEGLTETVDFVV